MTGRLLRGGQVVTPGGVRLIDVRVTDGRIAELGPDLAPDGEAVSDIGGLHMLPGAIDTHGHQWEPGFTSPPDFRDATSSAAVGGVTCLLDHPLTPPLVVDAHAFEAKVALGERTSFVDFGLHGGAAPGRLGELAGLWAAGATGIKVFTCPTGTALDGFDDPVRLAELFAELARIGALALVHAEDAPTLDAAADRLRAAGDTVPDAFDRWRTLEAEQTAVDRVLALAADVALSVYVVHTSHPSVVAAVRAAADHGIRAHVETCPHYLHLVDADLRSSGAWAMTAPPVRDAVARSGLLRQLAAGEVDTVGSDHCSVGPEGKTAQTFDRVIPGLPSLDLFLPLLLDLVVRGKLDLERLAELTARAPARIFGLTRKGSIEVGADADLAIVDLTATQTVRARDLPGSAGWSPYEGRTLHGSVVETWVRGDRVAREGKVVGEPGHGRFVPRSKEMVHG